MIGVDLMKYVFMTDASCDLTQKQVEECSVKVIPMEFQIDDNCYQHYPDCRMMALDEFYQALKDGADPKTTQINYLNFKSLAGLKYKDGADIDQLADYIKKTRDNIAHWFVVDDLDQLKRGGRISAVTATFGKALQIKPLISCDEIGKLVNVGKIRGTSNVIPALEKHAKRDAVDPKKNIAFVAHANNPEGAKELRKAVKGMFKEVQICDIGPVIGAHVGSGMLALVFLGKRNLVS